MSKEIKIGTWVEGSLFNASQNGKVVKMGNYNDISQFDDSGAMSQAIHDKDVSDKEIFVAVEFEPGEYAVYTFGDISPVQNL